MKGRGVIKAVTFDVGGTLIEAWPSVGHVYGEVAGDFGIGDVTPDELNRQFASAWAARHPFDFSRHAWQRVVDATFKGATGNVPSDECFEAIYKSFGCAKRWRVFDDVQVTL